MTNRAGLVPTVITNKNGVRTTVYRRPDSASAGVTGVPSPASPDKPRTFTGMLRELHQLGFDMKDYPIAASRSLRRLGENHPQVLDRVIDAIAKASPGARTVWKHQFSNSAPSDSYIPVSGFEHLIINAELTARLAEAIGSDIIQTPRYFSLAILAQDLEMSAGITHHSDRYGYVQAAIICLAVNNPEGFFRSRHHADSLRKYDEDIRFIEANLDRVITVLPELCKRRDSSRDMVSSLTSFETPSLLEGVL